MSLRDLIESSSRVCRVPEVGQPQTLLLVDFLYGCVSFF